MDLPYRLMQDTEMLELPVEPLTDDGYVQLAHARMHARTRARAPGQRSGCIFESCPSPLEYTTAAPSMQALPTQLHVAAIYSVSILACVCDLLS